MEGEAEEKDKEDEADADVKGLEGVEDWVGQWNTGVQPCGDCNVGRRGD